MGASERVWLWLWPRTLPLKSPPNHLLSEPYRFRRNFRHIIVTKIWPFDLKRQQSKSTSCKKSSKSSIFWPIKVSTFGIIYQLTRSENHCWTIIRWPVRNWWVYELFKDFRGLFVSFILDHFWSAQIGNSLYSKRVQTRINRINQRFETNPPRAPFLSRNKIMLLSSLSYFGTRISVF